MTTDQPDPVTPFSEASPIAPYDPDRFEIVEPEVPENLPRMCFWRVLILPVQLQKKTRSGLYIPDQAAEAQDYLNYMGRLVDMGPKAFQHQSLRVDGDDERVPAIGDYVMFGRAAGFRITLHDVEMRICEDRDIIAKIDSPRGFKILF